MTGFSLVERLRLLPDPRRRRGMRHPFVAVLLIAPFAVVADRVGLTRALAAALPRGAGPGWRDRGVALVPLACAIALGATNVLGAEQLQYQWRALFPKPVSDSTLRRALEAIDAPVAARVERVRAVIRRVVWTWPALRPGGFAWISVCGRELSGWYVPGLDATVVTCTSRKEGAAGTFKGTWRHHPPGAWVANTRECAAMQLRPGNAAANDAADHKTVLAAALRQLPLPLWPKLLVRINGAAFSHDILDHLQALTTSRRRVRRAPAGRSTPWTNRPSPGCRNRCGRTLCGRTAGPRDQRTRR
ncbi:hypothetical protein AB0N07_46900 [Streptomyces sp. NPDC051172]|uniref:hypothetical protein n=1 Tax=Streptomyces sp. NPDC051172 TaxID=3155796 RepID=UPI003420D27D